MTKRVKLTKPQRELLEEIAPGSIKCGLGYKPARKLVELGFAEASEARLGYPFPLLRITPAGRAYLAEDRADG